ncbi:MAG: F0F1 ATP synthase subunit A [Ramlibacter sp.]
MAAEKLLTPTEYISHHLKFFEQPVGTGGFWMINVDSMVMAVLLGVVGIGLIWWVARGATAGVPTRRQAFVELLFDFVDEQVRGIFHGDPNKFVAPASLTVFLWVLLMNATAFLPIDITTMAIHAAGPEKFRLTPTADINTTFALSLSVWLLMIYFSIAVKGFRGWIHELFCTPFGGNPLLWIPNLLFNLVELISKPLSHALRLFGNLYAGEIIFLLLWLWAATGLVGAVGGAVLGLGWAIFHLLIVPLQAYIFMMLTIVYISMAHESH